MNPGIAGDSSLLNLISWRFCGESCGTEAPDDADENENLERVLDVALEWLLC